MNNNDMKRNPFNRRCSYNIFSELLGEEAGDASSAPNTPRGSTRRVSPFVLPRKTFQIHRLEPKHACLEGEYVDLVGKLKTDPRSLSVFSRRMLEYLETTQTYVDLEVRPYKALYSDPHPLNRETIESECQDWKEPCHTAKTPETPVMDSVSSEEELVIEIEDKFETSKNEVIHRVFEMLQTRMAESLYPHNNFFYAFSQTKIEELNISRVGTQSSKTYVSDRSLIPHCRLLFHWEGFDHACFHGRGVIEPYFFKAFLWNQCTKKRQSETFHFDFNSGELLEKFRQEKCAKEFQGSKNTVLLHIPYKDDEEISPDVYLVVVLQKLYNGKARKTFEVLAKGARLEERKKAKYVHISEQALEKTGGKMRVNLGVAAIHMQMFCESQEYALKVDFYGKGDKVSVTELAVEIVEGEKHGGSVERVKMSGTMKMKVRNLGSKRALKKTREFPMSLPKDEEGNPLSGREKRRHSFMIENPFGKGDVYDILKFPLQCRQGVYWPTFQQKNSTPFVHELFVYPQKLNLGIKGRVSWGVKIQIKTSDEDLISEGGEDCLALFFPAPNGQRQKFVKEVYLGLDGSVGESKRAGKREVTYFCGDEVRIKLPIYITPKMHLLFTFYKVAASAIGSKRKEVVNLAGYAFFPLLKPVETAAKGQQKSPSDGAGHQQQSEKELKYRLIDGIEGLEVITKIKKKFYMSGGKKPGVGSSVTVGSKKKKSFEVKFVANSVIYPCDSDLCAFLGGCEMTREKSENTENCQSNEWFVGNTKYLLQCVAENRPYFIRCMPAVLNFIIHDLVCGSRANEPQEPGSPDGTKVDEKKVQLEQRKKKMKREKKSIFFTKILVALVNTFSHKAPKSENEVGNAGGFLHEYVDFFFVNETGGANENDIQEYPFYIFTKNWMKLLQNRKNEALLLNLSYYSWFYTTLIFKSIVLFLTPNGKEVNRKRLDLFLEKYYKSLFHNFVRQLCDELGRKIHKMALATQLPTSGEKGPGRAVTNLNASVAYMLRNLTRFAGKLNTIDVLSIYFGKFNNLLLSNDIEKKEKAYTATSHHQSQRPDKVFARVHLLILELCEIMADDDFFIANSFEKYEKNVSEEQSIGKVILNQLLKHVYCRVKVVRMKALQIFKRLLWKHESDISLKRKELTIIYSILYFPFACNMIKNLTKYTDIAEYNLTLKKREMANIEEKIEFISSQVKDRALLKKKSTAQQFDIFGIPAGHASPGGMSSLHNKRPHSVALQGSPLMKLAHHHRGRKGSHADKTSGNFSPATDNQRYNQKKLVSLQKNYLILVDLKQSFSKRRAEYEEMKLYLDDEKEYLIYFMLVTLFRAQKNYLRVHIENEENLVSLLDFLKICYDLFFIEPFEMDHLKYLQILKERGNTKNVLDAYGDYVSPSKLHIRESNEQDYVKLLTEERLSLIKKWEFHHKLNCFTMTFNILASLVSMMPFKYAVNRKVLEHLFQLPVLQLKSATNLKFNLVHYNSFNFLVEFLVYYRDHLFAYKSTLQYSAASPMSPLTPVKFQQLNEHKTCSMFIVTFLEKLRGELFILLFNLRKEKVVKMVCDAFYYLTKHNFLSRKNLDQSMIQSVSVISKNDAIMNSENVVEVLKELCERVKELAVSDSEIIGIEKETFLKVLDVFIEKFLDTINVIEQVVKSRREKNVQKLLDYLYELATTKGDSLLMRITWLESLSQFHLSHERFVEAGIAQVQILAFSYHFLRKQGNWVFKHLDFKKILFCYQDLNLKMGISLVDEDVHSIFASFTVDGFLYLVEDTIKIFERGSYFEYSLKLTELLIEYYFIMKDFPKLSVLYKAAAEYSTKIESANEREYSRVFGQYYYVNFFFGGKTRSSQNGGEGIRIIFKMKKFTKLGEFMEFLEKYSEMQHGKSEMKIKSYTKLKQVTDEYLMSDEMKDEIICLIQTVYVFEEDKIRELKKMSKDLPHDHFYVHTHVDKFTFEIRNRLPKEQQTGNELKDTRREIVVLETDNFFPFLHMKSDVIGVTTKVLTPVESACLTMIENINKLKKIIRKKNVDPQSLRLIIQGTVLPQVQGGIPQIIETFLAEEEEEEEKGIVVDPKKVEEKSEQVVEEEEDEGESENEEDKSGEKSESQGGTNEEVKSKEKEEESKEKSSLSFEATFNSTSVPVTIEDKHIDINNGEVRLAFFDIDQFSKTKLGGGGETFHLGITEEGKEWEIQVESEICEKVQELLISKINEGDEDEEGGESEGEEVGERIEKESEEEENVVEIIEEEVEKNEMEGKGEGETEAEGEDGEGEGEDGEDEGEYEEGEEGEGEYEEEEEEEGEFEEEGISFDDQNELNERNQKALRRLKRKLAKFLIVTLTCLNMHVDTIEKDVHRKIHETYLKGYGNLFLLIFKHLRTDPDVDDINLEELGFDYLKLVDPMFTRTKRNLDVHKFIVVMKTKLEKRPGL